MTSASAPPYGSSVEFAVLGTLQVAVDEGPVEITGAKERTVLARLVASAGRTVTVDDLVGTLWADDPPRSATKSVQNYVLRLRKSLEPDRDGPPRVLVTDGAGYRLAVPDEAVDARHFERLVELGRRALREGRLESAAATLRQALALWRGPAYAGFEDTAFGGGEARRLEELRRAAFEDRAAAELELGRSRECLPELEAAVHDHPLRERLWELLVLGLYREGRQADALAAYHRAREKLVDELGVEPGEALRTLHGRVLAQDVSLAAPRRAPRLPTALVPEPGAFVGRERELGALRDAWRRSEQRPGLTVVVRGQPGSGVRRLVSQFAAEVAAAGNEVRDDPGPDAGTASRAGGRVLRVLPTQGDDAAVTLVMGTPDGVPADVERLDVGPLAPEDVRALLETYLPEQVARDVLPDVLRRSGGRPGAVHDLAVETARRREMSRVETAAAEARDGRRRLDAARAELQDGVVRLGEVLRPRGPAADVCPWKGLAAYDVEDASMFAGRERLVAELVARVSSSTVLAVIGTSGSGKSSLVRAGLAASLRSGVLPGSEAWPVMLLRPGRHPMHELARVALRGAEPTADQVADLLRRMVLDGADDSRVVLVVDQAEELWTVCDDPDEREAFLSAVVDLAVGHRRAALVLVVRADHAGDVARRPELARLLSDSTVLVGPPSEAELRRAVELPAERAGLVLDVGLTDALVADAAAEPGVLPLLSTALSELWEHRDGTRLTLAAYARAGGVRGAVARLAERVYGELDDEGRAAVRVLMLRLAGTGEGTAVSRRRVPLAELAALPDPHVRAVVGPLAGARLLSLGDGWVEAAHEALYREWPRLRHWVAEDAETRAIRGRLAAAAVDWAEGGREPTDLWRGARLAAGSDLAAARPGEITDLEAEFLAAARAALDAERADAERRATQATRQNRRLRWLLGGVGVLLVVSLVAGVTAVRAGDRAEREALVAQARELASSSLAVLDADPELAVMLAVESAQLARDNGLAVLGEAEDALHRAVTASRAVLSVDGVGGRVDWSPDGRLFVTEGPEESGLVELRDARTGEPVLSWVADDVDINMARFSPDGTMLASAGDDGVLDVWDPQTGELLHSLPGTGEIWSPWFSPDGRTVAAVWFADGQSTVRVWDLPTRSVVQERPMAGIKWALAMSPDGARLAAPLEDRGTLVVWDARSGAEVARAAGKEVADVDFSPDGRWVATADGDHAARVFDASTGAMVHAVTAHRAAVQAVAWSPDARRLATAGGDGTVRVWDVSADAARPELTLAGQGTQGLYDAVFSPDGRFVMTGDEAVSAVSVFDVTLGGGAEWAALPAMGDPEWNAADFTPDGQVVASSPDATVTRWDVDAGRAAVVMRPPAGAGDPEPARALAVSPDGTLVAATGFFAPVATVWDAAGGDVAFVAEAPDNVEWVSWSPDSQRLVLSTIDGSATVVDRDGRVLDVLSAPQGTGLEGATYSPDGRHMAAIATPNERANAEGVRIVVWDVATGEIVREIGGLGFLRRLAYSPDGTQVAVGSYTGPARIVDVSTGEVVHVLEGHSSHVTDVDFSPDGRRVATSSGDRTARVWDVETGLPLVTLHGHRSAVTYADFSPDGRRLVTAGQDDLVRVWALDLDDLLAMAQDAVTRPMTDQECRQYLHRDRCETGT
ncbi:MAG: BTAD domain-containing putative transcriptional regulator [Actinomycetes bacterium]